MWTKRYVAICSLLLIGLTQLATGCATQQSVQDLEKRVTALEEKEKAKATEDKDRQSKLEECVNVEADQSYWEYVRLNGKAVAGKPGTYTAPVFVWDAAEKQKRDKVEECKLLYGSR